MAFMPAAKKAMVAYREDHPPNFLSNIELPDTMILKINILLWSPQDCKAISFFFAFPGLGLGVVAVVVVAFFQKEMKGKSFAGRRRRRRHMSVRRRRFPRQLWQDEQSTNATGCCWMVSCVDEAEMGKITFLLI